MLVHVCIYTSSHAHSHEFMCILASHVEHGPCDCGRGNHSHCGFRDETNSPMPGAHNLARGETGNRGAVGSSETAGTGTDTEGAANGREKGTLAEYDGAEMWTSARKQNCLRRQRPTVNTSRPGHSTPCVLRSPGRTVCIRTSMNRLQGRVSAPWSRFHQPYGAVYE